MEATQAVQAVQTDSFNLIFACCMLVFGLVIILVDWRKSSAFQRQMNERGIAYGRVTSLRLNVHTASNAPERTHTGYTPVLTYEVNGIAYNIAVENRRFPIGQGSALGRHWRILYNPKQPSDAVLGEFRTQAFLAGPFLALLGGAGVLISLFWPREVSFTMLFSVIGLLLGVVWVLGWLWLRRLNQRRLAGWRRVEGRFAEWLDLKVLMNRQDKRHATRDHERVALLEYQVGLEHYRVPVDPADLPPIERQALLASGTTAGTDRSWPMVYDPARPAHGEIAMRVRRGLYFGCALLLAGMIGLGLVVVLGL